MKGKEELANRARVQAGCPHPAKIAERRVGARGLHSRTGKAAKVTGLTRAADPPRNHGRRSSGKARDKVGAAKGCRAYRGVVGGSTQDQAVGEDAPVQVMSDTHPEQGHEDSANCWECVHATMMASDGHRRVPHVRGVPTCERRCGSLSTNPARGGALWVDWCGNLRLSRNHATESGDRFTRRRGDAEKGHWDGRLSSHR